MLEVADVAVFESGFLAVPKRPAVADFADKVLSDYAGFGASPVTLFFALSPRLILIFSLDIDGYFSKGFLGVDALKQRSP